MNHAYNDSCIHHIIQISIIGMGNKRKNIHHVNMMKHWAKLLEKWSKNLLYVYYLPSVLMKYYHRLKISLRKMKYEKC